jgi:dihydrofolate reductase
MEVNCIICHSNYSVSNIIPWHFAEDLKYFNKITTQTIFEDSKNAVIMGKNTFLSIGKILQNRYNYVLSSSLNLPNTDEFFHKKNQSFIIMPKSKSNFAMKQIKKLNQPQKTNH